MTTYEALLRTACEQSDSHPRLVLGDWLEERGDPQAEFFRSGSFSVIREFGDRFFGGLPGKTLDLSMFHLGDQGLISLAQLEWISRVRYLDLTENYLTDSSLIALAGSSRFSSLFRLSVCLNPITEVGLLTLARSTKTLGVILAYDNPEISYQGRNELDAIRWPVILDGPYDCWDEPDDTSALYVREEEQDRPVYDPLERERPDKSRHHGPGRARRRWWAGFQVSQVQKQRRRGER
jgi:uncharacterized protein (TIGR02996 family)